ncbi:MAG: hypothetical protein HYX76_08375 [Acidobacteria bacterium]|nr:hypothetical protein [Acidobacteriota bacterium]
MRFLVSAIILLIGAQTATADAPVSLLLPQRIAPAYSDVFVTARVPRHTDNRLLRVQVDNGDTFLRATDFQLDGEEAPIAYQVQWRDLPQGDYAVTAVVIGTQGIRGRTETTLKLRPALPPRRRR